MEEERDLVTFADDDGNEFDMEVLTYFDHEGQEYAVLADPEEEDDESIEEVELYIMKVNYDEETNIEEFIPADEDKMDELSQIVEGIMQDWDSDDEE